MKVLVAEFLTSAAGPGDGAGWPPEGTPEVAFAGRSNVGKSALLQALLGRRGLARVSATPGRTRLINFFRVEAAPASGPPRALTFVDLPGYGYARVAKAERHKWLPFVDAYLSRRASLKLLVLLVDARREAPFLDETEIARYVAARGVSVLLVMTKADKLAKHERKPALARLERALGHPVLAVSALSGDGLEQLWARILAAAGVAPDRGAP